MMLDRHPRLYLTAAFIAGILLTLGYKDFYPDLEQRYRSYARRRRQRSQVRRGSTAASGRIQLVETEEERKELREELYEEIVDGIEGCIGNTPLLRIKSLSEATGCDILAKAEVGFLVPFAPRYILC